VAGESWVAEETRAADEAPMQDSGAAARVWRRVLEAIYDGEYAPGQRLTEVELTRQLNVSRSSVREALSRLAAEGAVVLHRHRGAVVRESGKQEMLESLTVLDVLIGLAARLAAQNVTRPGVRDLAEKELRRLASPRDSYSAFELAQERNRFYRTLLTMAGNAELRRMMGQVQVHPLRMQLTHNRPPSSLFADYVAILAGVLSGAPERAEQAARVHVAAHIAEVQALPDLATKVA
jgi:DNA-binding GntR family transcriptional regulator